MATRAEAMAEVVALYNEYREKADECAHLCGCRRASTLVDDAISRARAAGWSWTALAKRLDVTYQAVQKRAAKARYRFFAHGDYWTPEAYVAEYGLVALRDRGQDSDDPDRPGTSRIVSDWLAKTDTTEMAEGPSCVHCGKVITEPDGFGTYWEYALPRVCDQCADLDQIRRP